MSAVKRLADAASRQRPLAERMPSRQPRRAWVIAVVAPLVITGGSRLLAPALPASTILFATLLVVVLVALLGGWRPAVAAVVAGLVAQEVFFTFPYGSLISRTPAQLSIPVVAAVIGVGIGILVDELTRVTTEQAALRRIAKLIARGMPPAKLFLAVAEEVAALLLAESAAIARLEPDGFVTSLAAAGARGAAFREGERWQVEPPMAIATVVRTRRAARSDDYELSSPELLKRMGRTRIRSSVAAPIIVEGQMWGVIVASSARDSLPAESEQRMLDFTELVATAIAIADSRSELAASRARIVAASDETRRRIERDLHDGVQQRLVSLALEVRAAESALPPEVTGVRADLSRVAEGLTGALAELQELSRGIHPAILSEGGLGPALRTLARRAPIPVALDVRVEGKLSDSVEVAAYYAVSELVTNTAKHAQASTFTVGVASSNGVLHISARDDGIGGADPARGSGIVGLRDRIEALGGTISVRSPLGEGTAVEVALPLAGDGHVAERLHDPTPAQRHRR